MGVSFHVVDEREARHLASIDAEVFDGPIQPESLAAFIADPRHVLVIAVDGGRTVGMATGVEIFQPDKAPQLFINELGVAPAYRRRGIGRRLLAMLCEAARARGCASAWVGTEPDNVAANALYRSFADDAEPETFVLHEWPLQRTPRKSPT